MNKLQELLAQLKQEKFDYYGKDFFFTWEKSLSELKALLLTAEILKENHKAGNSCKVFDSGLGISIFRDNSTRTRFSFASAVNLLGLGLSDLDEVKSQVAHGETVRETAVMISFLTEVIGIRDDMYLGEGNRYMREVADAVQDAYDRAILPQRPTLVNLQCDVDHPTQAMADLLKMKDYFGGLDNLRGKKIAMTWAYSPSYGKPLSVPQGIIGLMTRLGMEVELAYPEGYDLLPEITDLASKQAVENNGSFKITHDMKSAFKNADIVYPKSWAPFQVMQKRTELLTAKDQEGLKNLEKDCLAHNALHQDWECTREMMNLTRDAKALYMHCLPADITDISCKKGEVSAEVFNQYRDDLYHQAGFKPFVIAAMIFLSRFENPNAVLDRLVNQPTNRK